MNSEVFRMGAKRRILKIHQIEIARELGISPEAVTDIENCRVEVSEAFFQRFSDAVDRLIYAGAPSAFLDRDRSYLTKPGASQETLNALPPKLIDLISKRRMLGVRKDRLAKTLSIKLDTINDIEAGRIDVTNDFFTAISENVDKLGADRRGSARLDEANDLLEDADRDIRRLVLRRKAYGIHQLEVAHELFLSLATISDIELRRVGLSPAFEEKYANVIDKLSRLPEHPQHPLRRKRFAAPETDRIAQAVLDLTMKRKQLGIGQLRLAITLNLSPTTLADFECGLLELSDATKSRIERTIENLNQADRGGSHGLR